MKKLYLRYFVALLAVAGMATACSDDGEDDPVVQPEFPTQTTSAITSDEPVTLTVTPNLEWTVSIPTTGESASWFYIQDGSQQVYSVRGAANETKTITVCVKEGDEFDQDRTCEVSMTMGGQTRTIAVLTRYALNRSLKVYTARTTTSEEAWTPFEQDDEGNYLYNSDPVSEFSMVSLAGEYNYMHRLKIEANFPWAFGEYPETWMNTQTTRGEAGITEVFLLSDAEGYPFEDESAEIKFIDITDELNPVDADIIRVSIPGCANVCTVSTSPTGTFNAEGGFYQSGTGSYGSSEVGTFISTRSVYGSEIFLVVADAEGNLSVGDASSWLRFASERSWSAEAQTRGIWDAQLQLLCSANDGAAREAYLLAIPRSAVPEGFDRSSVIAGNRIASDYSEYVKTTFTQLPFVQSDFVELYEDMGSTDIAFTPLESYDWPFEGSWAGISSGYRLTYTKENAFEYAELKFNVEYASYEIYGEEGPYAEGEISPRWVDLSESPWHDDGMFIKIAGSYNADSDSWNWDYEKPVNPTAYFVFKDAQGQIIGLIEFKLEENSEIVSQAMELPGVTLFPLTAGSYGYKAEYAAYPQYRLDFQNAMYTMLNLPRYDETESDVDWIMVQQSGFIQMGTEKDEDEGTVIFKKDGEIILVLFCTFLYE